MKHGWTIGIMVLLVLFCSCSNPAVGFIHIKNPEEYRQVNESTQKILDSVAVGVLPEREKLDLSRCVYQYDYTCAMLGDPSVLIYLKSPFLKEDFRAEEDRLGQLAVEILDLGEGRWLYNMNADLQINLDRYTDEEVMDGTALVFEMAMINRETQVIEYLFASYQDSNTKPQSLSSFLDQYPE